jgi:PAS domain S-box-containing protein
MRRSEPRLPRSLSVIETWGFGFTVLLFWLVVAPEVHEELGAGALAVWLPAALAGIVVNLQIRKLALARPDAAGGSPVYVAGLWSDRPWVARWAGLAYFHSWAIVPPAISWLVAELAADNLAALGAPVSSTPLFLVILGAIYITAFSGIRVLSVVHLFFLVPSLGLLILLGTHGLGWLAFAEGSPGFVAVAPEFPTWSVWLAGYFLVAYTTYGIDTAAAFTADSRRPRATIECLVAAAVLVVPVMVGGSWLLAQVGPSAGTGLSTLTVLEGLASPLWGGFTSAVVTFMLASSMLLACATSVAITPRVAWQLSRDGVLASTFGRLDRGTIPRMALAFAAVVALLHIWLDPVKMILLGGASWVGFWCLMHLGLWRRRGDPAVLWPHLALGLAVLEGGVLLVGGWVAGGWWVVAGLLVPLALIGVDLGVRTYLDPRMRPRFREQERVAPSHAWEIVLVVALILVAVAAGWTAGRLVGAETSTAGVRVTVIVFLVSAFVGVAWASWTSLRKLEVLERARAQLRDVIESARDAVIVVDPEGRVRSANPAAEELFSRREDEVVGRSLPDLMPGLSGVPRLWDRWREHAIPLGDDIRTVEIAAGTRVGAPWGEFTVTIRDLTDRKAAEEALRASEARLDLALEAARAGAWDLDVRTGAIIRAGQWEALLGQSPGRRSGSLDEWKKTLHPEDRDEVVRRLERHIQGASGVYESEHRIRTAGGEWLWVLSRGAAVQRDDQGMAIRVLGTTADLSERKRLEHQLLQAQKMEAVGRLAGGVAHDFNNVLTAILGTAELILGDDKELDRGHHSDIVEIRDAAVRAAEITQQLLAFSRRQQLRPIVVDLNDAVTRVERLLKRLIGEDVRVIIRRHPDPGSVRADPSQLEQAILNLAVNARDAMPGGGTLTVETAPFQITEELSEDVEGVEPGPGVALSVSDTGEGMDEETRSRLFEPFFTTKEPGQGTGLGLAMVYGFVRQSGGMVLVETEEGGGSTLSLVFPRVAEAPEPPLREASDDPPPGGTETILVAEDEAAVRDLLRRILEKQGYRVVEAANGVEALAVAEEHADEIQLVIADLVMPEMGGRDLAEQLRAVNPELPILFISGYPYDPAERGFAGDAPTFLRKPFSPRVLLGEIRGLLDG